MGRAGLEWILKIAAADRGEDDRATGFGAGEKTAGTAPSALTKICPMK